MSNNINEDELLYFNGVNGGSGSYGLPPMTGDDLSKFIRGQAHPDNLEELKYRHERKDIKEMGPKEGVDPKNLAEAGWGVIFAANADPAIKEALQPLFDYRQAQAGEHFKIYEGHHGYLPDETKTEFLAKHGAGPGPADPDKVPYYLLLVGSPADIPYEFQYHLDVQYAVGRIHFDTLEGYANYARSVVEVEQQQVKLPRRVTFFGVVNPDDKATQLSTDQLIEPLFNKLQSDQPEWEVNAFLRDEATKAQLTRLLGGDQTPTLLFTASHGLEYDPGHPRQIPHQGALLCRDWPGPEVWRDQRDPANPTIPQDYYFAGDDLTNEARLLGLLTFHFACYGAGTPLEDDFYEQAFSQPKAIAPHPFVAQLPMRLLGHPHGGALAVIGHVERAWGYSFMWPDAGSQTTVFESTLERLLTGHPVGSALEYFDERYAELATVLADSIRKAKFGKKISPYQLAGMWTANNDARSYVIIGDPAVRLPVAESDESAEKRPVLELVFEPKPAPPPVEPTPPSAPPAPSPPPSRVVAKAAGDVSFTTPEATGDEVHFSAYHPRAIAPDRWHQLLVYAHLATVLEAVQDDMRQVLGRAAKGYRESQDQASTTLRPGTVITLVPQAQGIRFKPERASLTWSEPWQRAEFEMQATGERMGHVIEGSITCYVGPLMIADIRLPVVATTPAEAMVETESTHQVQSTKMYQAIFASYAHADKEIVEAVETAYKALGTDYLRDVMTLKSGQSWSDELLNMIDRADIFQLFWSAASSQSPYVEQEWQHALTLVDQKGPAFIRPVYWEKPLAPVPAAMGHIHFAPVDLGSLMASPLEAKVVEVAPPPAAPALAETLTTIQSQLASLMPAEDEDVKSITVSTYVTEDLANPAKADLKAQTRISLSGDVETSLPQLPGRMSDKDAKYLKLHAEMVREALNARLAYLKLIAQIAVGRSADSNDPD